MTDQQQTESADTLTCDGCGNPLHPSGSCDAGCPPQGATGPTEQTDDPTDGPTAAAAAAAGTEGR